MPFLKLMFSHPFSNFLFFSFILREIPADPNHLSQATPTVFSIKKDIGSKKYPPYLVKCFFLKNQGFFIVYSQMNEPRKWIFLSIWYKNSGIRVYEVKRLCFSFYMALCMPFPLRRRTSRVYQDHLTFPEGPNFLRSAYP